MRTLFAILVALSMTQSTEYPEAMRVVTVNPTTDTVICETSGENLFAFTGIEDFQVGDLVACIMDDNGTETIYDDEIVDVKYAGHIG